MDEWEILEQLRQRRRERAYAIEGRARRLPFTMTDFLRDLVAEEARREGLGKR